MRLANFRQLPNPAFPIAPGIMANIGFGYDFVRTPSERCCRLAKNTCKQRRYWLGLIAWDQSVIKISLKFFVDEVTGVATGIQPGKFVFSFSKCTL